MVSAQSDGAKGTAKEKDQLHDHGTMNMLQVGEG